MTEILSALVAVVLTVAVIILHSFVTKLRNQLRIVATSQIETLELIATLFALNSEREKPNATRKTK